MSHYLSILFNPLLSLKKNSLTPSPSPPTQPRTTSTTTEHPHPPSPLRHRTPTA
ncbi:hypothetical protein Hanom_Chr14g01268811 [Helianthus anomalus]